MTVKTLAEVSATRPLFPIAAAEVDGVLRECSGKEKWSHEDVRNLMIAMWLRGSEWRDRATN